MNPYTRAFSGLPAVAVRTSAVVAIAVAVASMTVLAPAGAAHPPVAPESRLVELNVLAINDFHGNLQPPSGSSGRIGTTEAGGIEYLATHVNRLRSRYEHSIVVSAGDLIGASPLLSALFHDEPTIEAMNEMGLAINAVGNHEFDEGADELLRMQYGGCHPVDGCDGSDPFTGAEFQFLAANVVDTSTGQTLFPPYTIRNFGGVRVAFIGMTLEGTPSIVTPSGVAGLSFRDEADTVNALVPELQRKKVEAIVVVVHEGGFPPAGASYNECPSLSGPIVDIVERLDPAVDAVISGHTHLAYNCSIDGRLVTSASSFGRLVTDIRLTLDRATRDVVAAAADNAIVTRDVPKDPAMTGLVDRYSAIAAPLANRVIGSITADITRASTSAGESPLGNLIADAQLAATDDPADGNAAVAFMNPGGIRTDLVYASSPAGEGDGNVTFGEAFNVQPFGNNLVSMSLTGAQIDTLLEQQWAGQSFPRILQVSEGFTYTWDATQPVGARVDLDTIAINGVPVDPDASYRVTVNSFLADGGDNFTVLRQGTGRLGGVVDVDALQAYFATASPVAPPSIGRITRIG